MSEQEKVFGELARRYIKSYGESLMEENQELRSQKVSLPKADHTVKCLMKQSRHRKFYLVGGLAAACLVLVVVWPVKNDLEETRTQVIAEQNQSNAGQQNQPSQSSQTSGEIIPLAFSLPENLTVKGAMVDQGQSVYLLADRLQDDVVLIMEKLDSQVEATDTTELMMIEINGHQVYIRSDAAYKQMICYQEDLIYQMTCRYDINTLLPVAEKIFPDEL